MTAAVQHARQEWEQAARRVEAEDAPALHRQVDAVTDELRRRLGSTFTLAELVDEYGRAETWTREVLAELEPAPAAWPRTLALVQGAAFHLYARGAVDYEP